jgi:YesN/AraC family two-component response regulator
MTKITLEDVAAHVYLSPSYLSKLFKTATGQNFNSYLNNLRIEHAKQLMLSGLGDLESVALTVGYEDQSYFTKVFKRLTGVTPKKFKSSNGVIST